MPPAVDVTFRLQAGQDCLNVDGILRVTSRRGEYIVECEGDGGQVLEVVKSANQYADRLNDTALYELWIEANDGLVERWVEGTLVVFSVEAEILRDLSLVPPGLDI